MTPQTAPIERAAADLAGRLAWLRERLLWLIEDDPATPPPVRKCAPEHATWPSTLAIVSDRFGLTAFEADLLLLTVAAEFDPNLPRLCQQAAGPSGAACPTFSLALRLFDDPDWSALSPHRPLRRLRLLEIHQPGGTPLVSAALRVDERIVNALKGLNELDDRLSPLVLPWNRDECRVELPPSQSAIAVEIRETLELSGEADSLLPIIQLLGTDRASKQLIARQVAVELGRELLRFPASFVPRDLQEQETLLRLWERELVLLPVGLYIDDGDTRPGRTAPLAALLVRLPGLVFLDAGEVVDVVGRDTFVFDIASPTVAEQRQLWRDALGGDDDVLPARMAAQFRLDVATIHELSQFAAPVVDPDHRAKRLWTACRRRVRPQLDQLAQRIDVKATWGDLVLPEEQTDILHEIATHVSHRARVLGDWGFAEKLNRGLGLAVLFSGESGTGKTMAAEVIAHELDLDLYRIDLSAVVNKYIGETEKNLRRVFDAAEAGGTLLLFDEADALFGRRTDVKDSHDRYANIEVNYLLQRMESFRGLAILATNLKSTIDQAFLRRLRYVVDFPLPDRHQRQRIWQRAFPVATPLDGIDFSRLADLSLTGGNIHTIAVNAAFASGGDPAVTMRRLLRAARTECRKLQKPVGSFDFREVAAR